MKKSYGFYSVLITFLVLILTGSGNAVLASPEKTPKLSASQEIPEGITAAAWDKIKASIEQDRYLIHQDKHTDGYRAPNPAHDLDAVFSSKGIEVSPRKGKSGWLWGLRLARYGYGSELRVVPAAEKMLTEGNRIEYHRGDMVEWYVNDRRGVEQGFTLKTPPHVRTGPGLLLFEMKTTGNLTPILQQNGKGIVFRDVHGNEALRYRGLYAYDAGGKALDARMAVDKAGIRLIVKDHGAIYPIVIDPFIETKKLLASDGAANDNFGNSVSISGNTAIVGARSDSENGILIGSAYIFYRDQGGMDTWGQVQKLNPSDGAAGDEFGVGVSINADTAIIGAYGDDDNGSFSGSSYIFSRDHGGIDNWGEVQKITASDGAAGDGFGYKVSINGDTAIVGSYADDDNGNASGSAYIFYRDEGGVDNWGQVRKLTPSDGSANDQFGSNISISADKAIVGAIGDDDNGVNSGSAYIFYRDQGGADTWGQVQKLTASDSAFNDQFGISVGISADTAIVGARNDDDNGIDSGSAYIFYRDQGGVDSWGEVQKLTVSDAAAEDEFGYSVSIDSDTAIVGARNDDDNGNDSGSAYIFYRDQGGADNWGEIKKIIAGDGAIDDEFGYSVSINGDTAIIGSYLDDDNGNDSGSAYIFLVPELAVDFGPNGLWHHDGTWNRMTTWDADDGMAGWSGGLGVDFGINGVWNNDGSSWSRITTWDAGSAGLTGWNDGMAVDFDANGLWTFNGSSWSKLTNLNPDSDLVGWDGGLAADFGGNGLWVFNGSSWSRLTTWNVGSAGLAGWNGSLAADFDTSGMWSYNGSSWTKLTNWDPEGAMTGWNDGLAVDFGANGLWSYDGSSWRRLTTWDPGVMTEYVDGLAVDFDANGMWTYDGVSWTKLTNWDAENLVDCDLY